MCFSVMDYKTRQAINKEEMKMFVNTESDYAGVESRERDEVVGGDGGDGGDGEEASFSLDLDKLLGILGSSIGGGVGAAGGEEEERRKKEEESRENEAIAEAMREELLETAMASTFTDVEGVSAEEQGSDGTASSRQQQPLDLDVNLIANMLESFSSQNGLPGPVSNICGDLGISLPDKK